MDTNFNNSINVYHSVFSDYYLHLYTHNVPNDVLSGLLQVFLIELKRLHGTSNHVLYLIQEGSDSVNHNGVQVLSIPILLLDCSQD